MKINIPLILICWSVLLTGCSGSGSHYDAAKAFLIEFKMAQFAMDASNLPSLTELKDQMKLYVTDDLFRNMSDARLIDLPLQITQ